MHNGHPHTPFVTIEKAFLLCGCFGEMFPQAVTDHKDENGNQLPFQTERPQLQFELKDKGNYYQLSLQYLVGGVPIKSPVEDAVFFVTAGAQYYLLPFAIQLWYLG